MPHAFEIFPTAEDVASCAGARLVAAIAARPGPVAICLSGGATPQLLFKFLAVPPLRQAIDWQRVHWFVGDERLVPEHDPASNMGVARRLLLDGAAPRQNVHAVRTDAADAAAQYEADLRQFHAQLDAGSPLFECVLLGIGPDGHTASLFPGSASLAQTERWVVPEPHPGVPPLVPRITLTPPCLGSARNLMFLVTGPSKRQIMATVAAGADLPATRVRAAFGTTSWLLDSAAAPSA